MAKVQTTAAFAGFPASGKAVLVPEPFFRDLLPAITDLDELRATLLLFWALHQRRGVPRTVSEGELRRSGEALHLLDVQALERGLASAVARGTFLRALAQDEERHYLLNTPTERRALAIQGAQWREATVTATPSPERNVFQIYEENIGPLTPMLAEELRDAEQRYPLPWLEDAFREAVSLNRRNWRYIRRILERWEQQGRTEQESDQQTAPRRTRSRYDHLIQR
ncbi:MAG TPA: DnaD domain protein [Dehalococcoidia bacterium]|nr:DnaD domain protein [Dehalococcoidia bacterium]